MLGAALVFAGAVSYAIYLIAGSGIVQKLGSMRFTAYASISASCFVIAHFMLTHGPAQLAVAHEVYWLTLLMATVSTVLPLWLMAEGLKRLGANQASLLACIGPIATIVLAHFFLGEPVTGYQLAGEGTGRSRGVMLISWYLSARCTDGAACAGPAGPCRPPLALNESRRSYSRGCLMERTPGMSKTQRSTR